MDGLLLMLNVETQAPTGIRVVSPIKTELAKLRSNALQIPNRDRTVRASDGQKIAVGAPGQAMNAAILLWER